MFYLTISRPATKSNVVVPFRKGKIIPASYEKFANNPDYISLDPVDATDLKKDRPHILNLVYGFRKSPVCAELKDSLASALQVDSRSELINNDNIREGSLRPSFFRQFIILSGRSFTNFYRNPFLMWAHYLVAIILSLICGTLFWKLSNDISAFQNRLGIFFFLFAVLSFGCLSSLQIFADERVLFVRERANGFYGVGVYFLSKVELFMIIDFI